MALSALIALAASGLIAGALIGREGSLRLTATVTTLVGLGLGAYVYWGSTICDCCDSGGYGVVMGAVGALGGYATGFGAARAWRLRSRS